MNFQELRNKIVKLVNEYDAEHGADREEEDEYPRAEMIDALACGLAVLAGAHCWGLRHSLNAFEHSFKIRFNQVQERTKQ